MKRNALAALAVITAGLLSGCGGSLRSLLPNGHEVEQVELIQTLGIDWEEGELVVTGSGTAGEGEEARLLTGRGNTLSAALLELQTRSQKDVSYSHVEGYLLGEAAVTHGIGGILDLLERDTELRMNTNLYVVRDASAGALMEGSSVDGSSITQRLQAMAIDSVQLLDMEPYTLKDLLLDLDHGGALVPAISMGEEEATRQGYACLQENTLVGWLEEKEARGVSLLRGEVEGASFSLSLSEGSWVALRLEQGDCRWIPEFQGATLKKLTASLTVTAAVAELRGSLDLSDPAAWAVLDQALEEEIALEAGNILTQSQSWGVDFLHLRGKTALAKPGLHAQIEEKWQAWFPALTLDIQVTAQVDRTYDIENSLLTQEGGGL